MMYNSNRLEWHLGERTGKEPRRVLCGLVVQHDESFDQFNRLVVALAKSQDHRAFCGVFCFWRPYSTRKQSVCMDGLEVNTAHLHTRVQNVTELGLGIGKAIGSSGGKLGQLYKRINPSSALGLFVYLR